MTNRVGYIKTLYIVFSAPRSRVYHLLHYYSYVIGGSMEGAQRGGFILEVGTKYIGVSK